MEKVKVKKYFHNVFLMSVLFHLILLALLNVQRVQKINFVKENSIDKFPPVEIFSIWQKEAESQQLEAKVNQQINPDISIGKVINEAKMDNIIEKMPIVERDLIEEQNKNGLLNIKTNIEKQEYIDEIIDKADVSVSWRTGLIKNKENNKAWNNSGGENITEEFNRKKMSRDFHSGWLSPDKPVDMGIFEKSNKVTITSVRVWVDSSGKVIKAEIFKSSGYIELDQLALNSIRKRDFTPDKNEPVRIAVIEIDFTNIR